MLLMFLFYWGGCECGSGKRLWGRLFGYNTRRVYPRKPGLDPASDVWSLQYTTQDASKIRGPSGKEGDVGELRWLFLTWFETGLDEPFKAKDWQGNHAFDTCNSFELKSDFDVKKG